MMKLSAQVKDNISEVLVRVIEFTEKRQKVLTENIQNAGNYNYTPKDLPTTEFSALVNQAIDHHICHGSLLLRDTSNIKFGTNGEFEVAAVPDEHAGLLQNSDRVGYLKLQKEKINENNLNRRIAAELLKEKQGADSYLTE